MRFNKELDYKSAAEREHAVLEFWKKNDIFKQSEKGIKTETFLQKLLGVKNDFIFYDGPPFATGLPHHGHLLQSVIKDVIARYKTMRGFSVRRIWGWDCHGLPLEVEVEKELNIKSKQEIIEYGIGKFNNTARKTVLKYTKEWRAIIDRIGRFVDMDNAYRTMDTSFIESEWNLFHRLHEKGYIKEDFRVSHFCTRCSTVLSNNEVSLGYKTKKDLSVYVKFQLRSDEDTYLVAWTTTPWTLFGNFALSVNKKLNYVKVRKGNKKYIIAASKKDLIEGEVEENIKGEKLVGLEYKPLFDVFKTKTEGKERWKVYASDFVTEEDGTGIVHIAPMYGVDDFKLGKKFDLPLIHHVTKEGKFIKEMGSFSDTHALDSQTSEKLVNELDRLGKLFKTEKIEHEYPFCWRCDSPLLNYATSSWFIEVPKIRDRMIKENKKINWVPKHIRDGRFGNWIKNSPDWAISRSRFWGAPIPVWKNKNGKYIVIDSLQSLKAKIKSKNKYLFVRHGEAVSNLEDFHNAHLNNLNDRNKLTDRGIKQAETVARELKKYKPNRIFFSPLNRTKQTALIISKENNIDAKEDNRLREVDFGKLEGKTIKEIRKVKENLGRDEIVAEGESYRDLSHRLEDFLRDCEKTHKDETIIVVTHSSPIRSFRRLKEWDIEKAYELSALHPNMEKQNVVHEINVRLLPKNELGEVDVHRPYIDEITLTENGEEYEYIGEVFDCWFESGSMPYASNNYPFSKENFDPTKKKGFPADFIVEAIDQTRGWFNSLLTLSVAGFNSTAYKNVVVTGLIRSDTGVKMSKSLKNYTDPAVLLEKYSADSFRQYSLSSPAVKGEDMNFSDSGVDEVNKKIFTRLHNCLLFYKNYSNLEHKSGSQVLLDRYILARLQEIYERVTKGLERYELDTATNMITDFVDDLSSWYLRRTRERIKKNDEDGSYARETLRETLKEFSKIIAPIAPFYAEYLFNQLRTDTDPISVHLCLWPELRYKDKNSINSMKVVRDIVSKAHDIRSREQIKVRQPLNKLTVKETLTDEEREIIMDEVNLKNVVTGKEFSLDTNITEELRDEGISREVIRKIQDERKKMKLSINDNVSVQLKTSQKMKQSLEKHIDNIKDTTKSEIIFVDNLSGEVFNLSDEEVIIKVSI